MELGTLSEKLKGFTSYYETDLKPKLDDLEIKRDEANSTFFKVVALLIVIFIPLAVVVNDMDVVPFLGFIAIMIGGYFYRKIMIVRDQAKLKVMKVLSEFLGITYLSTPPGHAISQYKGLSLIPGYDEKSLEDGFYGEIKGVDFDIFEAKLETVTEDSKGRKTRSTVFRGLLAKFDFHKNFSGTTIVTEDMTKIGNFLTGWSKIGERVKLEDPAFEKKFEVYSTDQIEARYLLTPTFMQRILHLTTLPTIHKIRLAFNEGSLLMAFSRKKDSFEGGSGKLNEPEYIKEMIDDLSIIFDTVNKLKLDQETKV